MPAHTHEIEQNGHTDADVRTHRNQPTNAQISGTTNQRFCLSFPISKQSINTVRAGEHAGAPNWMGTERQETADTQGPEGHLLAPSVLLSTHMLSLQTLHSNFSSLEKVSDTQVPSLPQGGGVHFRGKIRSPAALSLLACTDLQASFAAASFPFWNGTGLPARTEAMLPRQFLEPPSSSSRGWLPLTLRVFS